MAARAPPRQGVTRGLRGAVNRPRLRHRVVSVGHEPPSDALLLASPSGATPGSSLERPMSEAAWKAEKDRIAQRNDEARKAGKKERETQERERADRRRVAAARRDEAARESPRA